MKTFTAEVYNKTTQRIERVEVRWNYSPMINKAEIVEIVGKSGDIKRQIPNYQLRNLMDQVNYRAMLLTTEQRIEMMWGKYAVD